jgi:F420-non-reducing hydrogenase large subunit
MSRTITIDPVTRIEGHARILLNVDDAGQVSSAHLQVLEIRGFEKLLQGMELFKMPLTTARICGVCPAAHHLAAVQAIENGLGVQAPADARLLRELLYMGHILHSHALSAFVLAGPDILSGRGAKGEARNIFSLLRVAPELATKMLRLRSIGQRTVEIVGARGIHPVSVVPGGIAGRPSPEYLSGIAASAVQAVAILEELIPVLHNKLRALEWVEEPLPAPLRSIALSRNGEVSFLEGKLTVADQAGKVLRSFAPSDYAEHLVEHVVPGSYMKLVHLRGEPEELCYTGALARLKVNGKVPTPRAAGLLGALAEGKDSQFRPTGYIEARMVEMMMAAERMADIAGGKFSGGPLQTPCEPKPGRYVGVVEAPRGVLIHDYTADESGRVSAVNMIVATQANYEAIDQSLAASARQLLPAKDDEALMNGLEFTVRCFDPCLSCATHSVGAMPMEVLVIRNGVVERSISRREQ